MSSPWWLPFRLPSLLWEGGKGHVGATGLSAESMGHKLHICHSHSAQILVHRYTHAQCNPTVTTSISSGPFIMLVAALAKANGMAVGFKEGCHEKSGAESWRWLSNRTRVGALESEGRGGGMPCGRWAIYFSSQHPSTSSFFILLPSLIYFVSHFILYSLYFCLTVLAFLPPPPCCSEILGLWGSIKLCMSSFNISVLKSVFDHQDFYDNQLMLCFFQRYQTSKYT